MVASIAIDFFYFCVNLLVNLEQIIFGHHYSVIFQHNLMGMYGFLVRFTEDPIFQTASFQFVVADHFFFCKKHICLMCLLIRFDL